MSTYLFIVEAKLARGYVDVRDHVLSHYPNADVCFDLATLEVQLWQDTWTDEDENFFIEMRMQDLIHDWIRHTFIEINDGRELID